MCVLHCRRDEIQQHTLLYIRSAEITRNCVCCVSVVIPHLRCQSDLAVHAVPQFDLASIVDQCMIIIVHIDIACACQPG